MRSSSLSSSSRSSGSCQSKRAFSAPRDGFWWAAWLLIDISSAAQRGGSRAIGNDRRRFDLEAGPIGDERADFDERDRRIVAAHDLTPDGAGLGGSRHIFLLVEHVPHHARDVVGLGAGGGEDVDRVLERLAQLPDEVVAAETLLAVPADLAGDEDLRAARHDRIGIAFRPYPARRVDRTQLAHRHLLPIFLTFAAMLARFAEEGEWPARSLLEQRGRGS